MKTAYIFLSIKDMRLSLFLTYRRDHFNNNKFLQSMNDQKKKRNTENIHLKRKCFTLWNIYLRENKLCKYRIQCTRNI